MPVSIDQDVLLKRYIGRKHEIEILTDEMRRERAEFDKMRKRIAKAVGMFRWEFDTLEESMLTEAADLIDAMHERILELEGRTAV